MADDTLMDLIDAYAEARHVGGCHTYNAKTAEARAKVVASLAASAGSEPVAWMDDGTTGVGTNSEHRVVTDATKQGMHKSLAASFSTPLYLHHSPPEGMAGWTKAAKQLPPCGDDQDFIGINTAGFAGVFNAVRVIDGNTYCLMETAEESVSIMSDLDVWKPFIRPPLPASEAKEL